MTYNNKKTGAFIVPTGVGASIGGYAGDAGAYARKFAEHFNLIVNPNVVNAASFSAITDNMLYTEGYTLDSFFKGEINLIPPEKNKIGIIYDKAVPQDVLNIHINTQNAVKTVYGIDISAYVITDEEVGVEFFITNDGLSAGNVRNIETIGRSCRKLINSGCNAIAVVCLFNDADADNPDYSSGIGIDPVGGVEAVISHYISKYFKIPAAHSPAFTDWNIYPDIVSPKSAAEYVTPTFLPCILSGLSFAPQISGNLSAGINISNLDFLLMPFNSLGSAPVFETVKRNIKTYAILENITQMDVTKGNLFPNSDIIEISTYEHALNELLKSK